MKKDTLYIIALVCFALASPLVKLLSQIGEELGGAISFCNLLFIGNLFSGIIVLISFGSVGIIKEILSYRGKKLLYILAAIIIATLYPGMIYSALETTSVTNLVMLSRFESILFGLLAWIVLKQALKKNEIIGFAVIGIGVLAIVFVKEMYMFRNGDMIILMAAAVEAVAIIIAKETLKFTSLRAFLFIRDFLSIRFFYNWKLALWS